jgi:multidrug efflux pump subunit AcrA (membrane-fusion protein)
MLKSELNLNSKTDTLSLLKEGDKNVLFEPAKIELHTEEVYEIMGHIPPWILRRGLIIILSIVIILCVGSFIFKYPDVITSSIVIISENPSATIVARTNGRIDVMFAQNGENVKQNRILAILENSANSNHVFDLKQKVEEFSSFFNSSSNSVKANFPKDYSLGPIQSSFSNFQRHYLDYLNYFKVDISGKKVNSVRQQYKDYVNYEDKLKAQASSQEKTIDLVQKQLLRDSSLFINGVIPAVEYEKSVQNYLQVKNSYQSVLATIANTQMQINQLNYQVIDLESQKLEQVQTSINLLKEDYDNLKVAISDWEKLYVLISPIDGKITFNQFWNRNQYVTNGEAVFTIIPAVPQRIIGRIKIPISGSGKVSLGQKVLVRLDNFPSAEFGMLEGEIESISLIPETTQKGTFYTSEVSLPQELLTNYKNKLPFNQEMQGTAEIVTRNLNLFERLILPLRANIYK